MNITIQTKRREAISITFGFQSEYHSSVYWLTVDKLYYGEFHKIEFAGSLLMWFKHPKYWKTA